MVTKISKFRKKRNRLFGGAIASFVFAAALLAITGFFIFQNVIMSQKRSALEEKLQELQVQTSELSLQHEVLEANIADTQTEEYQEKMLREQGLYKKEGEEVVTILPAESAPEEISQNKDKKERAWWKPWTWVGDN